MIKQTLCIAVVAGILGGCSTLYDMAEAVASDPEIAASMVNTATQMASNSEAPQSDNTYEAPTPTVSSSTNNSYSTSVPTSDPDQSGEIISRTYSIQCPSGTKAEIPIVAQTEQCARAMEFFAETYSCNKYNDFKEASARKKNACGS